LVDPIRKTCAACYLIGAAADRLAIELAPVLTEGVELRRCADLEDAVRSAAVAARPGEVVLLSPACASFDAFENFERRGDRFREIVAGMA
jgi:UDP-N-acetylmuramoylalanine--D-glutamate ligase